MDVKKLKELIYLIIEEKIEEYESLRDSSFFISEQYVDKKDAQIKAIKELFDEIKKKLE